MRTHARGCLLVALVLGGAVLVGPAGVHTRAASPPAELVSTSDGASPLANADDEPSISGDGRIVVWTNTAPPGAATVPGGTYVAWIRDRTVGTSAPIPTPPGAADSFAPVVSRDGCHVAYWAATGPAGAASWGVYSWDRCANSAPRLVSPGAGALSRFGADLGRLATSADGRYVAYSAANDGPGTVRVAVSDTSADPATEQTIPGAYLAPTFGVDGVHIDISDDGAYVALDAREGQTNVVTGWVRATGARERITVRTDGVLPSANTYGIEPSVSADGRYVAFTSTEEGSEQVYVHDRATNTTRRLTGIPGGPPLGITAEDPEISPDGSQVVYEQDGPGQDTYWIQVTRSTSGFFDSVAFELVSYGVDDAPAQSFAPTMSATGRFVAFGSFDGVALSGNGGFPDGRDVWLRERRPSLTVTSPIDFGTVTIGISSGVQTAVVTNTSNVLVPVTVTPPAPPFSIIADGCSGVVLAPGETCNVDLRFAPGAAGNTMSVLGVDGDGATATATLRGAGATPGTLTLTPASHDFGSANLGTALPAFGFTVTNTGGSAAAVSSVARSGAGADQFTVTSDGCSGTNLAPAASCQIEAAATVTRVGLQAANLDVTGGNGQTLGAALTVTGIPSSGTTTTTTTTTTLPPPIDVVFSPGLRMNPGVVRPGGVTQAVGSGFPPGILVQLAFAGEGPFATVATDATGAFSTPLLILPNGYRLGGFEIVALDQPLFSGVRAPLLVNPASFEPSGTNDAGFTNGLRALYGRGS